MKRISSCLVTFLILLALAVPAQAFRNCTFTTNTGYAATINFNWDEETVDGVLFIDEIPSEYFHGSITGTFTRNSDTTNMLWSSVGTIEGQWTEAYKNTGTKSGNFLIFLDDRGFLGFRNKDGEKGWSERWTGAINSCLDITKQVK